MSGPVGDDHSTARGDEYDGNPSGPTGETDQFDVLLQLHTRFADLQKREHDLSQRLQHTERERNYLLDRLEEFESSARQDQIDLQQRELERQQQTLQERLAEIEQRESIVDRRQSELDEQQTELAKRKAVVDTAEEELNNSLKQIDCQQEDVGHRSTLRSQIEREIEIERTALLQLQATLEEEKQQHEETLAIKKREYDQAMSEMDARLEEEREQIRLSLIPVIEADLRSQLGTVDDARYTMEQERESTFEELRRQANELDEQRAEFEQRIAIEREQLEKDFERQRYELQDEKALFQKRYRFQFDHLQQSRGELEENVRVHRREEQILRVNSRHFETQLQRRMAQVDSYLDVIRKREESVERQARLARQTLRDQLREVQLDRDRFEVERQRWDEARIAQQADIQRQDRLLTAHAENLEERRMRLEDLRLELEQTHQTTLETRMAVEEAFAQLAQINGTEQTRSRIDAARAGITDHYSHIREGIAKQRAEIEASQRQLHVQYDEFRVERDELTQWMAERDERQRAQQTELDQQTESIDEWEAKWRQARDAWKQERIEAEHIIRDLLRQLTAAQVPGLEEDDVHLPVVDDISDSQNPQPIMDEMGLNELQDDDVAELTAYDAESEFEDHEPKVDQPAEVDYENTDAVADADDADVEQPDAKELAVADEVTEELEGQLQSVDQVVARDAEESAVDDLQDDFAEQHRNVDNDYDGQRELDARFPNEELTDCLLYTSPSPRDQRGSRMPSSA